MPIVNTFEWHSDKASITHCLFKKNYLHVHWVIVIIIKPDWFKQLHNIAQMSSMIQFSSVIYCKELRISDTQGRSCLSGKQVKLIKPYWLQGLSKVSCQGHHRVD